MSDIALKIARAVDADTFVDDQGTKHRVLGIDAPESGTPAGEAATDFAQKLLAQSKATVEPTGEKGYYGRELSNVPIEGTDDFATRLVRQGHARPVGKDPDDLVVRLAEQGKNASVLLGLSERGPSNEYKLDVGRNVAYRGNAMHRGDGSFVRGVGRGIDQLQNLLYSAGNVGASLIGDIVGTEAFDDVGIEGIERNMIEAAMNPAELSSWDDVDGLADTYTYVMEALGEQAINIASFVGTGGLGGAAKAAVSQTVKAGVAKRMQQLMLQQGNMLTKQQRLDLARQLPKKGAFARGQTQAVAGTAYTMGVGEIGNELREGGIDSPVTALVGAVPFAALDTFGFQRTIGRLFNGVDRSVATQSVKEIAGSIFRAAGLGAAAESSTEMLQEVITLSARAFHDPEFEIFSDENLARIKEAGIKAGIVGGVGGGGATAINKVGGKLLTRESPEADTGAPDTEQVEVPDPSDPGGPPPGAPGTFDERNPPPITEFDERGYEYEAIPEQDTVPASAVGQEGETPVSIRETLEKEVEPAILAAEAKINAYEALRLCLAK